MTIENTFKFKEVELKEKQTEIYLRCIMILSSYRRKRS